MNTNKLKTALIFLGAMMLPVSTTFMGVDLVEEAYAATTSSVTVTAVVPAVCNMVPGSTTNVTFPSDYDPTAVSDLAGTGAVSLRCTKNTAYEVFITLGANSTGANIRRMTDGVDFLTYQLYKEVGHSNIWGVSGPGNGVAGTAPSNAPIALNIFANIANGQDVQAGSYTDTVVASVSF